ncbi:hypothetical protein JD844_003750 [Phrynosoma platyrhinos]|uniref:ALS2 C-terminal-like protein n=1 Tax=Phrynosoma platyrhinos TaxID=52577 RepID=A0ABQ7TDS9_PHRPL|nr:hypothetical protein JD844_003750 [Phrynosoma platyrhinos]
MSIEEVASSLLRIEETFSACLARINSVVLKPLLQLGSFDHIKFFLLLNDHFHVIWDLTEENYRALKQTLRESESANIRDVYLTCKTDLFLNAYIQYFSTFASCVVVQGFEHAARSRSEVWKSHKASLQQLLEDFSPDTSIAVALHTGLEKEAVANASGQFAKLRSFISQALDEACLTRNLWKSLSRKFTGNGFQSFDLKLVWVDKTSKETGKHTLRIRTPEGEFFLLAKEPESRAVWQWKLNQAVRQALNGKRDFPLWGEAGEGKDPPLCRFSTFTFRSEGRLKNATYEGEWCLGKPHGKGTLTWPDGRNYVGDFKDGLEHGFGICLVPHTSEDRYDCYKCHWREGRMSGYGICDVRQGFGVLDNTSSAEHPFKYTGHWENDKKSGYGVWDDKERGERYIGMWHEDQRHGTGIVVMQSGVCYRRTFHLDKMVGSGILLLEDGSMYEGNFTRDLTFVGKGKLTFPNGFTLEGTFTNKSNQGLQTQGVLNTSGEEPDDTITKIQLGREEFPVEQRWEGLYVQFLEFISSGGQGEMEESFMGFHVQTSKELRKSQEYLFCDRYGEVPSTGKLLKALTLAFQATYGGIGANKHLLAMAQEEVKHYAKKMWEFYQGLRDLALAVKGQPSLEDSKQSDFNGPSLILPFILPCFYPELLMLYMLYHEKEDDLYCQGIVDLSLFPDVKLLEFLDVQKHFWPLKDLTLTTNQRRSLIKDRCFLSATECLQKLIIQHLGAEIHLIRDLMDPANEGGMHDFLLTALEVRRS